MTSPPTPNNLYFICPVLYNSRIETQLVDGQDEQDYLNKVK